MVFTEYYVYISIVLLQVRISSFCFGAFNNKTFLTSGAIFWSFSWNARQVQGILNFHLCHVYISFEFFLFLTNKYNWLASYRIEVGDYSLCYLIHCGIMKYQLIEAVVVTE